MRGIIHFRCRPLLRRLQCALHAHAFLRPMVPRFALRGAAGVVRGHESCAFEPDVARHWMQFLQLQEWQNLQQGRPFRTLLPKSGVQPMPSIRSLPRHRGPCGLSPRHEFHFLRAYGVPPSRHDGSVRQGVAWCWQNPKHSAGDFDGVVCERQRLRLSRHFRWQFQGPSPLPRPARLLVQRQRSRVRAVRKVPPWAER